MGCSRGEKSERAAEKSQVRPIDACALFTAQELQAAQGEALSQTTPTTPGVGDYTIAQCYFALPTNTNSVVITVAQRGSGPGGKEPREFWEETFHREGGKEGEREEEEEKRPPLKVEGVGEEAYWVGSAVGGALYVLKGDLYLRVSTGGKEQIERSKKLAQIALAKL